MVIVGGTANLQKGAEYFGSASGVSTLELLALSAGSAGDKYAYGMIAEADARGEVLADSAKLNRKLYRDRKNKFERGGCAQYYE